MLRRFVLVVLVGVLAEAVAFTLAYDDLIALRHPNPGVEAAFIERADRALARRKVTRAHLEAIASQAQSLGLASIEVRALDACARMAPDDTSLALRRADALRRAGDYARASRLYQDVLARTPGEQP